MNRSGFFGAIARGLAAIAIGPRVLDTLARETPSPGVPVLHGFDISKNAWVEQPRVPTTVTVSYPDGVVSVLDQWGKPIHELARTVMVMHEPHGEIVRLPSMNGGMPMVAIRTPQHS